MKVVDEHQFGLGLPVVLRPTSPPKWADAAEQCPSFLPQLRKGDAGTGDLGDAVSCAVNLDLILRALVPTSAK